MKDEEMLEPHEWAAILADPDVEWQDCPLCGNYVNTKEECPGLGKPGHFQGCRCCSELSKLPTAEEAQAMRDEVIARHEARRKEEWPF